MPKLFKSKVLAALFSVLILFTIATRVVFAAPFSSSYSVVYDFSDDGSSSVMQAISLINNTTDKYPSDYTLTLGHLAVEKVSAFDDLGPLKVELTAPTDHKKTKIKVVFNKKALGKGTKLVWTIKYQVPKLAVKNGRMWEINIPFLTKPTGENIGKTEISSYDITIKIPQSFGAEHYVKPPYSRKSVDKSKKSIYYFKDILNNNHQDNLLAAFGNFQLYNFKLTYHLYNPAGESVITEIALPPDFFPYQKVYYKVLKPKPQKIRLDPDGNYLAKYKLKPKQKLNILYQGQIKITARPPTVSSGLLNSHLEPYLLPAKFWQVNNENILKLQAQISKKYHLDKQSTRLDWAQALYDYVTTTLQYNSKRIKPEIKRYGALKALEDPKNAVCMEYTDLLITLLRSVGIPARELDGFAMTNEDPQKPTVSDTLHAWVQFFDEIKGVWQNVDPTWGSTTKQDYFNILDTNHIIFAIKGLDSERPYPAGSYKVTGQEKNDVQITYANKFESNIIPFSLWQQSFEQQSKQQKYSFWLFLNHLIHWVDFSQK